MAFKGEVAAGYEMDFGIRQIAIEGFGSGRMICIKLHLMFSSSAYCRVFSF